MEGHRNYLRMHRRRWCLTQAELALLFGYLDQSIIARLECDERAVSLNVAHASELIFGVESNEIFPALFKTMEASLLDRVQQLRDPLMQGTASSPETLAKLELLHDAVGRITGVAEQEV